MSLSVSACVAFDEKFGAQEGENSLAELKDFLPIRIGEMPGLGLRVEVLDEPRLEGLLPVSVVVVDLGVGPVRAHLLAVAVVEADFDAAI